MDAFQIRLHYCIYIYILLYMYMSYTCKFVYIYIYIYVCMCMRACECIHIYVCMCIYTCARGWRQHFTPEHSVLSSLSIASLSLSLPLSDPHSPSSLHPSIAITCCPCEVRDQKTGPWQSCCRPQLSFPPRRRRPGAI